jgi:multicomponent Na+:H+ antiporter subunit G
MNEWLGLALVTLGIAFEIAGCIGLVRMPDVYNRLQTATKCVTAGTCLVLIGAAVAVATLSAAIKCALAIGFVLVTSPTAAHALARAAHRSGVPLCDGSVVDRYREGSAAQAEEVRR